MQHQRRSTKKDTPKSPTFNYPAPPPDFFKSSTNMSTSTIGAGDVLDAASEVPNAQEQLDLRRLPQLCNGGGSDGMNQNTAAYASAPVSKASLRLRWLARRLSHGDAKSEALNLSADKTSS
jgi:hypothetical protein